VSHLWVGRRLKIQSTPCREAARPVAGAAASRLAATVPCGEAQHHRRKFRPEAGYEGTMTLNWWLSSLPREVP